MHDMFEGLSTVCVIFCEIVLFFTCQKSLILKRNEMCRFC